MQLWEMLQCFFLIATLTVVVFVLGRLKKRLRRYLVEISSSKET